MTRKASRHLKLGQERAAQALRILVSQGRIKAREVHAALKREKLVLELRERLAALESKGIQVLEGARRTAKASARRVKRRVSPARRAAMKAQGRYLAAIRRLPKAARAKIKAIREKSGVRAAIAALERRAR